MVPSSTSTHLEWVPGIQTDAALRPDFGYPGKLCLLAAPTSGASGRLCRPGTMRTSRMRRGADGMTHPKVRPAQRRRGLDPALARPCHPQIIAGRSSGAPSRADGAQNARELPRASCQQPLVRAPLRGAACASSSQILRCGFPNRRLRRRGWRLASQIPKMISVCAVSMRAFDANRQMPNISSGCIASLMHCRAHGRQRVVRRRVHAAAAYDPRAPPR